MILSETQSNKLYETFSKEGLTASELLFERSDKEVCFVHKLESTYVFELRDSIYNVEFCDVYCQPFTYLPHYYKGCDTFGECLELAKVWARVVSYKLTGKTYIDKLFISHSSKDTVIIDDFIDKILKLSCGYKTSNIIYTSRQTTGVEPGDGIPSFIKENIYTADYILFMISNNYKQSEVCLNEMGAAWALDKKIIPILLPDVSFDKIGWLTSFNKAIKINERNGLDRLFTMLSRGTTDAADWNIQRDQFLKNLQELH